ncbi:MAG TPA: hypothetical protein ENK85_06645 [Saprospiraceae bacterium]|nr:hypothetical protein [Saprospiraceae bacterium]
MRQEIRATSGMLQKTKSEKKQAVSRLLALNIQIKSRRELIDAISLEVDSLNHKIVQNQEIVDILSKDLASLQTEYAKILQNTLRYKYNKSPLLFLFSADSFNQAFKRWLYLRQYNRYRSQQLELIASTSRMLQEKVDKLSEERDHMQILLASVKTQNKLLEQEKAIKNTLVSTLKKDAKSLRKKLAEREKEQSILNQQISSMIAVAERKKAATEKALKERNKKSVKTTSSPGHSTPSPQFNNFGRARGKLSWPADGYITGFFGRHPHPMAPKVLIANNGVDIRIHGDPTVSTVFSGEVLAVEGITGRGLTILVKHGEYYTVYANLKEVFVQAGDKVGTLQTIGTADMDASQTYPKLHFELWKGKKALNPVRWLKK